MSEGVKPMETKVQVIFYSMYGHVHKLAVAIATGAMEVPGVKADLFQVAELVPEEALKASGGAAARKAFAEVPLAVPERMAEADAIIFGAPTRFGNMAAQMRNFLDQTGRLWNEGALLGKVGSAFSSTGTQHGGQETTILSFHTTMLHHGMIIAGLPYALAPALSQGEEMSGGTPYGATTIASGNGARQPSPMELEMARIQGRYVADLAAALKRGKRA